MSMQPEFDSITGGTALRIPAMQSPNFAAGSTGWIIRQDGTAEFNSGTFRGSIAVGPAGGPRFVVNNSSTGDVIDIYDSSNRLIFSLDSSGNLTSFAPASAGDPYIRMLRGIVQFNHASGFSTADPPSISAPVINVSTVELDIYSGTPDGVLGHQAEFQMFGGTTPGAAEIRATQRGVTGDLVQLDTTTNANQIIHFFHGATTIVDLGGGFLGARFAHGASFTPVGRLCQPFDGPSVTTLFTFNLETVDATNVTVSARHADGTVAVVGENTECWGVVWE